MYLKQTLRSRARRDGRLDQLTTSSHDVDKPLAKVRVQTLGLGPDGGTHWAEELLNGCGGALRLDSGEQPVGIGHPLLHVGID